LAGTTAGAGSPKPGPPLPNASVATLPQRNARLLTVRPVPLLEEAGSRQVHRAKGATLCLPQAPKQ